ncbi:protein asteroid homolog 1 isoform X2 [Perognathus longimembris pacificus]|nr:protein asteroid homolog 1 isoform X2 [Perognathus longimembris pacificus]
MGIRGLMSFVEDHSNEFFTDLKLRDTKLVIDGYALFHRLCFNSNLELRYGGDYDSFADVVQKFFESLFACNIRPYVVLDGGCDISDKKLTTLKDRLREKIQAAHSLSVGGGGYVCPLLIREVFIQVLIKLQVCFVQCFSEADRDIMTLANHWNCPVLSSDSDFCIFDLHTGFCPLSSFQWRNRNALKGTQDYYIPAKCFSLGAFCRHFRNMNRALLPLFAVLCGNDYVSPPFVDAFLSKIRLPLQAGSKGRRHHRILGLLNWLSHFADPAEALDNILKYLPQKGRENVKELLCCSMEEYQQSQAKLQDFFRDGVYICPDARNLGLPEWVQVALAKGQLSPFISDALVLRRTILHTQVENMKQPNAHRTSQPIRQTMYGLLSYPSAHLENLCRNGGLPPRPGAVSEVERIHKNIKTSVVGPAKLPEDLRDLGKLVELPLLRRQRLLLETLGVNRTLLEPIPAALQLPVAVSCYWLQHAEPRAELHHLQALLLAILTGPLGAMARNPGKEHAQTGGARMLYEELQSVKGTPGALHLDTAHLLCQWQSCLQMGLYLNQLLGRPLPEPDLTRLYSGSLVHGLCQRLQASVSVEGLLGPCPEAEHLYQQLFTATKSCAPAELFLPKRKPSSRRDKQKKKGTGRSKNRVGATPRAPSWRDGSNRFALLMCESPEAHAEACELE